MRLTSVLRTLCVGIWLSTAAARSIPEHATVIERATAASSTYDFVIAGGGIAGLTVADRLTEDPSVRVLVIEAGPFDGGEDSVLVPGAYNPDPYLWPNLFTVPQEGLNSGVYFAICGRVVGGGSAVNAMIFVRGGRDEYGGWAALGSPGWTWTDFLPFFKKSENFTEPDVSFAAAGNISWDIGYWHNAVLESSILADEDPNDGTVRGVYWLPLAEDAATRTRSYARLNHYERVIDSRPNYHLLASTTVSRVIFTKKKVVGIEFVPTDDVSESATTVYASKEVLVATGGIHTPQLLQLSGIGPKALLSRFGIPIVSDLPDVGQNFQDQPTIPMAYNMTTNVSPNWGSLLNNATYDTEEYARYEANRTGPYTLVRTVSTNFASLALKDITPDYLDIIKAALARNATEYLPRGTDPTVAAGYRAQRTVLLEQLAGDTAVGGLHWNTYDTNTLYTLKPLSRGTININSTNIADNPLIDYRTATDPTDLAIYKALFKKNRQVMSAPSMAMLGPAETSPFGTDVTSDVDIEAALISALSPTNGHECCTAAMLPLSLGGVVDSQLRVYGVTGLRVIDISYWPYPLAGAPSATMYASGEKIATLIKAAYGLQ